MVLVFRMLHNYHRAKLWDKIMPAIHAALKDGGVLAVEQHRAAKGAEADATAEKGYLPQAFVVEKIESYGFKLQKSSEMNANPKDTKDYPEGVWTLPPTLALGEKDKAKYEAIGESDRMTLRFVKVTKKK
jgi:predicted methyltransferase